MNFSLKRISELRCKELESLNFINPESNKTVQFTKESNFTVVSDDEYYVLVRFFPRPEFISERKYQKYALFMGKVYVIFEVHVEYGNEKEINGIKYPSRTIEIKENEDFKKYQEKNILEILKDALIEENQKHFKGSKTDVIRPVLCSVYYNGEEIK